MNNGLSKNPIEILHHRSAARSAKFIEDNGKTAMIFPRKQRLWPWVATQVPAEGVMMECGVFKGRSINAMAKLFPERSLFGFDSFEGLQEDWIGADLGAGAFDQKGVFPEVEKNVTLIKGWVQDTLPPFLKKNTDRIAYLHIDTDTYTPAKFILQQVKPRLVKGSIVLFDELIGYPFWEIGEYLALTEVLPANRYKFIAFSQMQAAIKIVS